MKIWHIISSFRFFFIEMRIKKFLQDDFGEKYLNIKKPNSQFLSNDNRFTVEFGCYYILNYLSIIYLLFLIVTFWSFAWRN